MIELKQGNTNVSNEAYHSFSWPWPSQLVWRWTTTNVLVWPASIRPLVECHVITTSGTCAQVCFGVSGPPNCCLPWRSREPCCSDFAADHCLEPRRGNCSETAFLDPIPPLWQSHHFSDSPTCTWKQMECHYWNFNATLGKNESNFFFQRAFVVRKWFPLFINGNVCGKATWTLELDVHVCEATAARHAEFSHIETRRFAELLILACDESGSSSSKCEIYVFSARHIYCTVAFKMIRLNRIRKFCDRQFATNFLFY